MTSTKPRLAFLSKLSIHMTTTTTTTTMMIMMAMIMMMLMTGIVGGAEGATVNRPKTERPRSGPKPRALRGCEYEGKLYPPKAQFKPEPCTHCRCPKKGGPVQCTVEDCVQDARCIKYGNGTNDKDADMDKASCCPACVEFGCLHSSGKVYRPGDVIREEACVRCYCPLGGGNPVCDVTTCPLSQCVDPIKVPGVCCPVCPQGPNCQIGLLTLPIGQSVMIEGALCRCETFEDWDRQKRTLARCNKN